MINDNLSFIVIGAGAIGGITAALMKEAGYNVEIATRSKEYASEISNEGVEISGVCGNYRVKIPAYSESRQIKEKKDVIILATKAGDLVQAAKSYRDNLKENGCFISLQNGMCEDEMAAVAGSCRIVGCVTGWGATMEDHGKMIMTSEGDFIIGYPGKMHDAFLTELAKALSSVVPTRVTDNITGHKYSKLIINSCITSLGAICGLYLGEMLSKKKIRRIFIEIIREAVSVADAMQLRIEVFSGKLDFSEFVRKRNLVSGLYRHLMIRAIGFKYRKLKSSSLQSLERGQRTEIDFLNGYIVRHGVEKGIETPVNSAIVNLIHQIEAGEKPISTDNFNEKVFDRFN